MREAGLSLAAENPENISVFDADAILKQTFVQRIQAFKQLPSTNDFALQMLAEEGFSDGPMLVLTERQTQGRGRDDRAWWSSAGGLTFSLVMQFDPQILPRQRFPRLAITTGLAVWETLQPRVNDFPVGLKWPNDVYLGDRKVCGILIESPGKLPSAVVVGVGLNVNNSFADAPPELRQQATSLRDATDIEYDLNDVLICILQRFEDNLKTHQDDEEAMIAQWQQACILTGKHIRIRMGNRLLVGECQGIDSHGRLLVKTDAGVEPIASGSLEKIGPA